ncbi:MAG: nucleotidyl transferase AbiEii/AbiGii toxin family protein [Acidimicrobiia bacterium]
MLRRDELATWASTFRVADEQVRRDHLISHLLAAMAALEGAGLVFFGGTALARTHLPAFRLSEDVDLLADPREEWHARLEGHLPRALRRHFGPVSWDPAPSVVAYREAARLVAGDLSVRLQFVRLDAEQARWPVERRPVEMRYADAPSAQLVVPTRPAFAAMKALAWADRHAPRDLADLAALAALGAIDASAAALVVDMAGWTPGVATFDRVPPSTRAEWSAALRHQMAVVPDPDDCLREVRDAWVAVGKPAA